MTPAEAETPSADTEPGDKRSPIGTLAAMLAFFLPLGHSSAVTAAYFTPKAAILLVLIPVGLLFAVAQLWTTRRAAGIAALSFLAWCTLSTALSETPLLAVVGGYGAGTGLLFVAVLVGCWAMGRSTTDSDRRLIGGALLGTAGVSSVIAVLQTLFDLGEFELNLIQSRAGALLGNPVHLAAFLTGATALAAHRFLVARWPYAPLLVLFGAGLQVAGSRLSLLFLLALAIASALRFRRVGTVTAASALTVLGLVLGRLAIAVGAGVSATERLAGGLDGAARRFAWQAGWRAALDRPLVGAGPGRFLYVGSRYSSLEQAQFSPGNFFRDAHNIFVEYLSTVGFVGLAALVVWLVLAGLPARGEFALFAAGVFTLHLAQPLWTGTTPLMMLALGCAAPAVRVPIRRLGVALAGVGTAIGVIAAARFTWGDYRLRQAELAYSPEAAAEGDALMPPWPEPASAIGQMYVSLSITERDDRLFDEALKWHRKAPRRDPLDFRAWGDLGGVAATGGRLDEAERAYRKELSLYPHAAGAHVGLARVAIERRQPDVAERHLREALRITDKPESLERIFERVEELRRTMRDA